MKKQLLVVAASAALLPCMARASALVDLQVLGSTDGQNYSSTLQVVAGQTYDFEVVGQLASVGTVNAHPGGTITSEVAGVDGIGSTNYNLIDNGANPVQISFTSSQLQGTYSQGFGGTAGTPASSNGGTNNELDDVRPINPFLVYNGVNGSPVVMESGTFTVPSAAASSTSQLVGVYGGQLSGFKINNNQTQAMSASTESGSDGFNDPYQQIAPLTLTTGASPVPEPASVAVFGLGAIGLLARRRRTC
jgi:hypothetical protein